MRSLFLLEIALRTGVGVTLGLCVLHLPTVDGDGRNPAPVDRWFIPFLSGFIHPMWCRISSINSSNMWIAPMPFAWAIWTPIPLSRKATWLSRGWCRAEWWCHLLSNKMDPSRSDALGGLSLSVSDFCFLFVTPLKFNGGFTWKISQLKGESSEPNLHFGVPC